MGKKLIFLAVVALSLLDVVAALATGPKVSASTNKHNLSSASANTYRAIATGDPTGRDTEICIFCHTPHNSTPQGALWNRKDTPVTSFGRYSSPTLYITHNAAAIAAAKYGEPNGSSRLCLSCHDGVTALGLVKNGAQIFMQGGNDLITGIAKFDANKVKLGHHPVSFVYDTNVVAALVSKLQGGPYKLPTLVQRLDKNKYMQCATCHDPHMNQSFEDVYPSTTRKVAPFWAYHNVANTTAAQDHDALCQDCHAYTSVPGSPPLIGNTGPWPWP